MSRYVKGNPLNWWYRFVVAHVTLVLLWIGLSLLFGPASLTTGNSLQKLHDHTHVPWSYWGVAFLVLAVLLQSNRTRIFAYAATAFLAIWFIVLGLAYTYFSGKTSNIITLAFSTLAPTMLMAGVKYAIEARRLER